MLREVYCCQIVFNLIPLVTLFYTILKKCYGFISKGLKWTGLMYI